MAPLRDARGRFAKANGQTLGEAVGRFRIDTSGIQGVDRVVGSVADKVTASGGRMNNALQGIADGFKRARQQADEFNKSNLGQIQQGINSLRQQTQLLSAAAGGLVAIGLASANSMNSVNARFTVFLGSAQKARAELDKIRQIADATGQPFTELAESAADLLSVSKNYKVEVGSLLTIAQQLKAVDPSARSMDSARAIREFLSGNNKTLNAVFELDREGLDKVTEGATNAADRLQRLSKYLSDLGFGNEILKGLADQGVFTFGQLKSEIEEALGTAFMPLLQDFVLPAAKAFGSLVRGLRETNPELLKFAAVGVVIAAGIAPALLAISGLINAYKTLKTVSNVTGLGSGVGKALGVGLAVAGGVSIGTNVATGLAKSGVRSGDLGRIAGGESANDILGERLKQSLVIVVALIIQAVKTVAQILTGGGDLIAQAIDLIFNALKLGAGAFQVGFGQVQNTLGSFVVSVADLLRKIPGLENTADSVAVGGLNLQGAGQQAILQGTGSVNEAQARLQRGIDLNQTAENIKKVGDAFDDAQNQVVGTLNAVLFPVDQLGDKATDAAAGLDQVAKKTNPLVDKIVASQEDIEALATDIAKQRKEFDREQKQQNDERRISAGREAFDFALGRSRSESDRVRDEARDVADRARSRAKQITNVLADISNAETEGAIRRQEIIAEGNESIEKMAEDHGKRLEKIQLDTNANVANAAARLDANAVFEAQTSGLNALNQENDQFTTETQRKREELDKQVADLDKANGEIRTKRLAALQQQFADEDAELAIDRARKEEDRLLQQKREDDDRALRLARQQEDYNRQDSLRREALQRNINDQIAALSQSSGINQRMLTNVVNGLAAAGGHVSNFVAFVNSEVAKLGISANGNVPVGSGTGRPTPRITPTFALGGIPPINQVFGANERGLESAIVDGRYFAMLSQPAQIMDAQSTQRLLAGAGAGGGFSGPLIGNLVQSFGDIGSYSPTDIEGMVRKGIIEAAQDVAALLGGG